MMEELSFAGFEIIHPPAGANDVVVAAPKAGKTPTEIASSVGTTTDEVAASVLKVSTSSRAIEVEATKERLSKRYSPPMSPISSLECKRYDDDDGLSIVSSVTHVKTFASVYSHECSVFTEMPDDQDPAIDSSNAHQNHLNATVNASNHLQGRRNRFARKVLKRLSSLPLVSELEASVHSEQSSSMVGPKKKRFAKQALRKLSILRKNSSHSENKKRLSDVSSVASTQATEESSKESSSQSEQSPSIVGPTKKRFAKQALGKLSILRKNSPDAENKKVPSDASTAASTQATEESSKVSSSMSSSMNSSITISTADFDENPSRSDLDNLAFQSYLFKTPWDVAKSGDYATLNYIANNEDESDDVWTKQDVSGNVPLYYACAFGGNFGKWGLESVKLLLDVWPNGGDVPDDLLKRCLKETQNKAVKKILREKMGSKSGILKPRRKSSTVLEGTENVTPQSFLDDLGDDGYVEDY